MEVTEKLAKPITETAYLTKRKHKEVQTYFAFFMSKIKK